MPPIKELRFFDRPFPRKFAIQAIHALGRKEEDPSSVAFIDFVTSLAGRRPTFRDMNLYERLFDFGGGRITGDISPSYGGLPDDVIASIASRYPDLKVVLLLRDPISRLWSAANNAARRGKGGITDEILTFQGIQSFVEDERVLPMCFPSQIFQSWSRHFSPQQFRYFFLDDVIESPESTRANILTFLGVDPRQKSGSLPAGYNSKQKGTIKMSDDIAGFLAEHFKNELLACSKTFGGPAEGWPARYGLAIGH